LGRLAPASRIFQQPSGLLSSRTDGAPCSPDWASAFASELVQHLQIACREFGLESAVAKLDKYHLVIRDDIAYVSKPERRAASINMRSGSNKKADAQSYEETIERS
jgi:hypothetical protein